MKIEAVLTEAAVADMFRYPNASRAVREAAERSQEEVVNLVMADVLRELRQEPGPVVFPNLRLAFMGAIKGAKHSAVTGIGMGYESSIPGLKLDLESDSEKAGSEDAASSSFDWGKFAAGLFNTVATVGTQLYLGHEQIEAEKDKLELAQQQLAVAQQPIVTTRPTTTVSTVPSAIPASSALPGWLIPVGIGVAGLFLAVLLLKR